MKQKTTAITIAFNLFFLSLLIILMSVSLSSCSSESTTETSSKDSSANVKNDSSKLAPGKGLSRFVSINFDRNIFNSFYYENPGNEFYQFRFIPYVLPGETNVRLYGMALRKGDTTSVYVIPPDFILPLNGTIKDPRVGVSGSGRTLFKGLIILKSDLDIIMAKINPTDLYTLDLQPRDIPGDHSYEIYLNNNPTGKILNPSPPAKKIIAKK